MDYNLVDTQAPQGVKLLQILSNRGLMPLGDATGSEGGSSVLAFEQLASTLLNSPHSDAAAPIKSFALMGAAAGVGASTVAVNLAQTIASSNKSVLVAKIAADVSSAASASDSIDMAIKQVEKFHYMELSITWLNQMALKNESTLSDSVRDLERKFNYVLWDLPPVDRSAWSRLICQNVGGVILVVEAGQTRWRSAKHALHLLQLAGANVLGVVLNKKKMYIPTKIYRFLFRDDS